MPVFAHTSRLCRLSILDGSLPSALGNQFLDETVASQLLAHEPLQLVTRNQNDAAGCVNDQHW